MGSVDSSSSQDYDQFDGKLVKQDSRKLKKKSSIGSKSLSSQATSKQRLQLGQRQKHLDHTNSNEVSEGNISHVSHISPKSAK